MKIPYRTRRTINRIGFVSLMLLMALAVFWFCWVIFAQRYVVYTRDGAVLDLSYSSNDLFGEVAMPPQADEEVSIYYNEGDNSIELGNALTQLDGYYITADDLTKNLGTVWSNIERLPMGSTVMIDLKGGYGSFYYSTNLSDGIRSQSVATASAVMTVWFRNWWKRCITAPCVTWTRRGGLIPASKTQKWKAFRMRL